MTQITDDNFKAEVLEAQGRVLVDFFATWCGPCKMLSPILHGMEKDYEGKVRFVQMDTDEAMNTAMAYGIQAIPTVILFENGKEVNRFVGLQSQADIKAFLA